MGIKLPRDFRDLLRLLNAHGVEHLAIDRGPATGAIRHEASSLEET